MVVFSVGARAIALLPSISGGPPSAIWQQDLGRGGQAFIASGIGAAVQRMSFLDGGAILATSIAGRSIILDAQSGHAVRRPGARRSDGRW